MKTLSLFIVTSLLFLAFSCKTDDEDETKNIIGQITSASDCKSFLKSTNYTADTISSITYSYDEMRNELYIKHSNAGFNCCPESIYIDQSYANYTISIVEMESTPQCHCNCLYDIEMNFKEVLPRSYQILIKEPYIGEQEELSFSIDLANKTTGTISVTRKKYPWGIVNGNTEDLPTEITDASSWEDDSQLLERILNEIQALSAQYTCDEAGDWTFTAYGSKACGGPVGYLPYSTQLDTKNFLDKVEFYTTQQDLYNVKWNVMSDCSVPLKPEGIICDGRKPVFYYSE